GDHLLVNKVAYAPALGFLDKLPLPITTIERGFIVTFKGPPDMSKDFVKRVIGLPGETIKIIDKKVYIDGTLLDEPYTYFKGHPQHPMNGDNFPLEKERIVDALGYKSYLPFVLATPQHTLDEKRTREFCKRFDQCVQVNEAGGRVFKVPEGHYFCMGDNRDHSDDSRFWGPLPAHYILGKPWRVYWSFESETKEYLTQG
ncbi:MAG: signal peptidase I, partial [bacterium]|nr:signal peptidase I [bacterium]